MVLPDASTGLVRDAGSAGHQLIRNTTVYTLVWTKDECQEQSPVDLLARRLHGSCKLVKDVRVSIVMRDFQRWQPGFRVHIKRKTRRFRLLDRQPGGSMNRAPLSGASSTSSAKLTLCSYCVSVVLTPTRGGHGSSVIAGSWGGRTSSNVLLLGFVPNIWNTPGRGEKSGHNYAFSIIHKPNRPLQARESWLAVPCLPLSVLVAGELARGFAGLHAAYRYRRLDRSRRCQETGDDRETEQVQNGRPLRAHKPHAGDACSWGSFGQKTGRLGRRLFEG